MEEKTFVIKINVDSDTDYSVIEKYLEKCPEISDMDLLEVYEN